MAKAIEYPGRNTLINNLRDFFCIETVIDKSPYSEIMEWNYEPRHDYGLIIKAFAHFRNNGIIETLEYFDKKYFEAALYEFNEELVGVSLNLKRSAANIFYTELRDIWVPMITNLPEVAPDFGGMDELKLPEFRIERVEEDIPPGENLPTSYYGFLSSDFPNPFSTPGKRWVDKQVPVPPETPEQIANYFSMYNELINGLRSQFLTIANKYISLWGEGEEQSLQKTNAKEILENPFPTIFTSIKGFQIFDKLIKLKKKNRYNDYCVFVYRQLIKDGFMIEIKHAVYKEFMESNYEISLDKFKHYDIVYNEDRFNLYSIVRDSIQ